MQDRKENPKGQKPKRNWKLEVCELILQLFWMGSGRWQPQKTRDLDLHTGTGPKDEGCCLWKVGSWNWDPLCRVRTLKGIVALEKRELEKYLPTGIGRRQGSLSVLAWGWVKEKCLLPNHVWFGPGPHSDLPPKWSKNWEFQASDIPGETRIFKTAFLELYTFDWGCMQRIPWERWVHSTKLQNTHQKVSWPKRVNKDNKQHV